jgi:hypothetical protein
LISVSEPIHPALLSGRALTGVLGDRSLPDRIEGGPGVLVPEGVDHHSVLTESDLAYWHLLELWVEVEGLGWIIFLPGLDTFTLHVRDPDPGWHVYIGDQWRESTIDAPAPLAALVGATISDVPPLYYSHPRRRWWQRLTEDTEEYWECGYILETTKGSVAIANLGTCQYGVAEWPGDKERWQPIGVVTDPDPLRIPSGEPRGVWERAQWVRGGEDEAE